MQGNSSKKALTVLMSIVFVDLVGFGIILPLIPLYARCLADGGEAKAGLLFLAYSGLQLIVSPFLGRISDKHGRRPILIFSIFGKIISMVIFAYSTTFGLLLMSRMVAGACTANISVAKAYIADISLPNELTTRMGLIGAAIGCGFILGPFIGGHLAFYDISYPPLFVAFLGSINLLATYLFLPETIHLKKSSHNKPLQSFNFKNLGTLPQGILFLLALTFFHIWAFGLLEGSFAYLAMDAQTIVNDPCDVQNGIQKVGNIFALIGLVMLVVQGGVIRPLVKKYSEISIARSGFLLLAIFMLGLAFYASKIGQNDLANNFMTLLFYTSVVGISVGQGFISPTLSSLLSQSANEKNQGLVLGVGESAAALGRTLGPAMSGLLYQYGGAKSPFLIGGLMMAFLVFYTMQSKKFLIK